LTVAELMVPQGSFFAHPLALVDTDRVGDRTRIWAFTHILQGALIGSDCNVGEHCYMEGGATLGNHVTVKNGVSLWAGVTVEDNCFLGPHCVFTNDPYARAYIKKGSDTLMATLVKENSTIGANATVICGNTIGQFAFVGAGAVVTRDVEPYAIVVGNPARPSGWLCECAGKLPMKVSASIGNTCACDQCGAVFARVSSGLARK
jgi:UDP-2-acetamido-3-amino-2,3-dideoxy-glucuronate N-acetyltransferase